MPLLLDKFLARVRTHGTAEAVRAAVEYVHTRVTFRTRNITYKMRWSKHRRSVYRSLDEVDASPKVTFVVPVYDRERMLIDCVASIQNEGYQNTEIILVLDGSPEGTVSVARQLEREDDRVRVIALPTQSGNAVWGRNIGISQSTGEFVFLLDSDDLCSPGRISATLEAFRDGDVDVVYGGYYLRYLDGTDRSHSVAPSNVTFDLVKTANPIANSTAAVRRSAFLRFGMLKRTMHYREDHELWLRLAYMGCVFRKVNAELAEIVIHGKNNEERFRARDAEFVALMSRTYFERGPRPIKVVFVLPGLGLSGGIYVVLRHANALADVGYDVAIVAPNPTVAMDWYPHRNTVRILPERRDYLDGADVLVATGWQTALTVAESSARNKLYFVQSDETRFVDDKGMKKVIGETYKLPFTYLTEARWIIGWLRSRYGWTASYVPNGVDDTLFSFEGPSLASRGERPRVLLEGPLAISWKGVADAYDAVADLDCDIWLVSSAGRPPKGWRIDRFFERVPMAEMGAIYRSCDIFVKMSRVEGFFGPPLEAMACGCAVVVSEVTGRDEFIVHDVNALVADMGDIAAIKAYVKRLIEDPALRKRLVLEGARTAAEWTWDASFQAMRTTLDSIEA